MDKVVKDSLDFSSFERTYKLLANVGSGGCGTVMLAQDRTFGTKVAIKKIPKKAALDVMQIRNEVSAMRAFSHPNLCQLHGVYESMDHVMLVMEYLQGGSLTDYIKANSRFDEKKAHMLFSQIVSAVAHMHEVGFSHRDLKSDNVMLDSQGNAKIIDFGLCANEITGYESDGKCHGSRAYMPPEFISTTTDNGEDRRCADTWSLGCIFFQMLTGEHPFWKPGSTQLQTTKQILNAEFTIPWHVSPGAREILKGLLNKSVKNRMTCKEVMEHSWLVNKAEVLDVSLNLECDEWW